MPGGSGDQPTRISEIDGLIVSKPYIGVKGVLATRATKSEFNMAMGRETPDTEDPDAEGYLVEHLDGGLPNHPDYENYISWCPKAVFDRGNVEVGNNCITELWSVINRIYISMTQTRL